MKFTNYKTLNPEKRLEVLKKIFAGMFRYEREFIGNVLNWEKNTKNLSAAYLVLGKLGDETDVLTISQGLRHRNSIVRMNSVTAFQLLGTEFGLPFILDMIEDTSKNVRRTAFIASIRINFRKTADFIELRLSTITSRTVLKNYIDLLSEFKGNPEVAKLMVFADKKSERPYHPDFQFETF